MCDIRKDLVVLDEDQPNMKTELRKGKIVCSKFSSKQIKDKNFLELPNLSKTNVNTGQKLTTAKRIWSVIKLTMNTNDESEQQNLPSQVIVLNKPMFLKAAKTAGLNFRKEISVSEATNMMSLLRLSGKKMREFRCLLRNTEIGNFIPSESRLREEQARLTSHLDDEKVEVGKMPFKFITKENKIKYKERAYFRVKSWISFINKRFNKIKIFRTDIEFGGKIWLYFSGDKGGDSMKYHVEIINDSESGSRDKVDTYCMFEAPDYVENLWKVYHVYRTEILMLHDEDFLLDNGQKGQSFPWRRL